MKRKNVEDKKGHLAPILFCDRKKITKLNECCTRLSEFKKPNINSVVIIRDYAANEPKKTSEVLKMADLAKKFGHKTLLGKAFIEENQKEKLQQERFQQDFYRKNFYQATELSKKIKACGLHFSDKTPKSQVLARFFNRKSFLRQNNKLICSYSCHDWRRLRSDLTARNWQFDLIFLSPIFATSSHPNQRHLGIFWLRKAIKFLQKHCPDSAIYALGGVNLQNLKELSNRHQRFRVNGFGAIDLFLA